MSSGEKKVIFSGVDSGASNTAKKIFSGILSDAQKYSSSLKDQTSYIKDQIKVLEQKAALTAKIGKQNVQEQLNLYQSSDNTRDRDRYRKRIDTTTKEIEESSKVVELLRGIFQESKKQSTVSEKAEKDQKKKSISSEQQYEAMKSLARQEIRENLGGVKSKIKLAEKNDYSGLDPRSAEKLMYQKSLVGEDKKSQNTFTAVFAGVLAAGIVQKFASALGTMVGSKSGEQSFNSLLGAVPIAGGVLSGSADRSFQERYGVQVGTNRLRAVSGRNINIGGFSKLGYSTRENVDLSGNLINAAGTASNLDRNSSQSRLLEKGLGLSNEVISQIVKDLRTTRSSADIMQIVTDVLKANPELRKDQTKFAEILQQTSQLTNTLASQTENVDPSKNAGIVGALRSIGGSFADPTLGPQRMMSINSALTNPGTEYQKGRSFGILSGLNPGMSYFQMLEAQEKGIGSKGYLSGMLKQFQKEGGGGENMMLQVKENLGLGASTSRKLVEAFERNPKMFDNFSGSNDDLEKMLGESLTSRAEKYTARTDKESAIQSDKYLEGMFTGIGESFKQTVNYAGESIKKFSDNIIGKDATDAITKFNAMLNGISSKQADLLIKSNRVLNE